MANDLNVTLTKDKLLEALRKNRTTHQEQYDLATVGFKIEYMKRLRRMMKLAKSDKSFETFIDLQKPVSYVKKYDEAISMLESATDDNLQIDSTAYRNYVLNEWSWAADWGASNSGYMVSAIAAASAPPPTGKPGRPRKAPPSAKKL